MTLAERMRARGVGEAIIERVIRLNGPNPPDGVRLRGIHRKETVGSIRAYRDLVSKGHVIRTKGRDAWDKIPGHLKYKFGCKRFISRAAYEDNIWMVSR